MSFPTPIQGIAITLGTFLLLVAYNTFTGNAASDKIDRFADQYVAPHLFERMIIPGSGENLHTVTQFLLWVSCLADGNHGCKTHEKCLLNALSGNQTAVDVFCDATIQSACGGCVIGFACQMMSMSGYGCYGEPWRRGDYSWVIRESAAPEPSSNVESSNVEPREL